MNKFLPASTGSTLHWICETVVNIWNGQDTLQRVNLLVRIARIANQNPPGLDHSPWCSTATGKISALEIELNIYKVVAMDRYALWGLGNSLFEFWVRWVCLIKKTEKACAETPGALTKRLSNGLWKPCQGTRCDLSEDRSEAHRWGWWGCSDEVLRFVPDTGQISLFQLSSSRIDMNTLCLVVELNTQVMIFVKAHQENLNHLISLNALLTNFKEHISGN